MNYNDIAKASSYLTSYEFRKGFDELHKPLHYLYDLYIKAYNKALDTNHISTELDVLTESILTVKTDEIDAIIVKDWIALAKYAA